MIPLPHPWLSREEQEHIAHHRAYLATVWINDPQRAQALMELLTLTYQYESIAAGDILLALDYELHSPVIRTA